MSPPAQVEVLPATFDQMPILANLLQLYAHDFSEFHDVELDAAGRFHYAPLSLYWSDPGRHPFLVKLHGKPAGFVLVKKESSVWDMAEFFVVRGCRRRGLGTAIAHNVWRRFPGPWEVRVIETNHAALQFWERAISEFSGAPIKPTCLEKGGRLWQRFAFDSRSAR